MKNIGIIILFCIATIVLIALSRDSGPSSPLYPIKRSQENIILLTKTSPSDKIDYYLFLLDNRLKEIQYIMESGQYELLVSASLRYSTTAGTLTKIAKVNNLSQKTLSIKTKFLEHKKILDPMVTNFPEHTDRWKFLKDAENYLDTYSKELP